MTPAGGRLRVMFCVTSMPVGGAEALLADLLHHLDRERFAPELCCLKAPGPFAQRVPGEVPVFARLLAHKHDLLVVARLARLFRRRAIDAVVTVGAGDKMFWGRLAARAARVPVVACALHSTGWPDEVGRLNRLLTPLTDAFIAVAPSHGRFLVEVERLPRRKVTVIPNGVDVRRFAPRPPPPGLKPSLGVPADAPVLGIVAALRPEKNHAMFLEAAARLRRRLPELHFLVVGDGPCRGELQALSERLGLAPAVRFTGDRADIPELLAAMDAFALSSLNEANPVSILEAMACGKPVVAPRVGSIADSVSHGVSGLLIRVGDTESLIDSAGRLLEDPALAAAMGRAGRRSVVERCSLERMVEGYQELLARLYRENQAAAGSRSRAPRTSLS